MAAKPDFPGLNLDEHELELDTDLLQEITTPKSDNHATPRTLTTSNLQSPRNKQQPSNKPRTPLNPNTYQRIHDAMALIGRNDDGSKSEKRDTRLNSSKQPVRSSSVAEKANKAKDETAWNLGEHEELSETQIQKLVYKGEK